MEQTAYIGLGSNLGDRQSNLQRAVRFLSEQPGILSVCASSFYETQPLASIQQPAFLNGVARVTTDLPPRQLLTLLLNIEQKMGRKQIEHWGPRIVDLDILLFDGLVIDEPDLKIPHRQMHLRTFALNGLCELDPNCVHPVLHETVHELAGRLNGKDFFLDPLRPQLVSVAGNIGVGKTTLAQSLAHRLEGVFIAENYSDNPYLAQVYAGRRELALDSELFFLSSGAAQLESRKLQSGRLYVSDYVFDKAMIYASSWLNNEQMNEYKRYYDSVADGVAPPVLVIYLNDSLEHCLERIHSRNRPYEQTIEKSFLEHLQLGYESLYRSHTACPVMRMTSDRCFTSEQVDTIAHQVRSYAVKAHP